MRLHDYLDYYGRETPDAAFAVFEGRELLYADALAEANRIAHALMASGLEAGDRFAVLAKNCPEFALLYFAASKAGVIPVPLNYRLAPPEWSYIVEDAGARLLVARGGLMGEIDPLRSELKSVERYIALGAQPRAGWESWSGWLEAQPAEPPARAIEETDDLYQMYTSGTTGHPKGAVLTHRAVTANVAQLNIHDFRVGDSCLIVVPMYHAAATVSFFWVTALGGTICIQEDFDPAAVVRALSEEGITAATLVPAMIQACLVLVPDVAERNFDDLRFVIYGASPIAAETLRRAMEVFGCDFAQAYGMTEATAVLTSLMPRDHERALRDKPELLLSAGRPLMSTEIRIVDENGSDVPPGTVGEIIARGPQLMRSYWNLPEASGEALRGGWFHTGDAGSMDEGGYLYVQDRVKDMIVSGAENVYPREVENVLFTHPAIADVAVIGVPDDRWGESVKAIVVLREGQAATDDEIMDYCRGRLAGFKRPRSVDFIDELPRNPSGKVLKRVLREPYWKGHERRVS